MTNNNTPGREVRQERFVHPNAAQRSHELATIAKLRLIYSAACDKRLKPISVRTLAIILDRMYGRRVEAWPGQETLANVAGISVRSIQYAVHEIEALGYIQIFRQLKLTNLYVIPGRHLDMIDSDMAGRKDLRSIRSGLRPADATESAPKPHGDAPESWSTESLSSESGISESHIDRILEAKHG